MRVDDVMQCDNVRVFEVLEKGYFSDGSAGCSLLMLQSDLLQGYQLARDTARREREKE